MTDFDEVKQASSWPPTNNGMPALDDLYTDTLLWQYIAADGVRSLPAGQHALVVNLARLSDKAVREYRIARDCMTSFFEIPTGVACLEGHTTLLCATDHLENCIDAIRRAEGHFDTHAFKDLTSEKDRDMLKDLHEGTRRIRNAIQHAEERLDKGRIPEDDPLFPAMTTECVYFAGEYLPYAEIAALVMEVWQLASAGVVALMSTE